MDISKFKHQHLEIRRCISELRHHSKAGIAAHAAEIARLVNQMSSVIKLHLAAEDRGLYPALRASGNRDAASLGDRYQQEMSGIVPRYMEFARKWITAAQVRGDPEGFRADANRVLKALHDRVNREDRDFYPVVEQMRTT
jgi:hypothetical protein